MAYSFVGVYFPCDCCKSRDELISNTISKICPPFHILTLEAKNRHMLMISPLTTIGLQSQHSNVVLKHLTGKTVARFIASGT